MRFYRNYRISKSERLVSAGLFSLVLHISLLFLVSYIQPDWKNFAAQEHPLQVILETQPAEPVMPPSGIPLAGEESAGEAIIGIQEAGSLPQERPAIIAIAPGPGDQPKIEIPQGPAAEKALTAEKILAVDKAVQLKMAERLQSFTDSLAAKTPNHETPQPPQPPQSREAPPAQIPSVAKPLIPAPPPPEKLVSSEPVPGEKREKIVLVEPVREKPVTETPVHETPGRVIEESKRSKAEKQEPLKAEEPRQAKVEELKPPKAEEAKPARIEAVAEHKAAPAESGKPEAPRGQAPASEARASETPKPSALSIPLVRKIAPEQGKTAQPGERRKAIGFKERDFRYAMYMEGLRLKLERIGSLNYPAGPSGETLSGALSVRISIRSDGSLENFSVVRPSKHKELDAGAEKIVSMSAPFSPLPESVRLETDVLTITIKWTFSRSGQSFD